MLKSIQALAGRPLLRVEGWFNAVFGATCNPFYYLGALTIFFFWVVLVSGIYVFILFKTSVFGAYASVEYITHGQPYLGGIMRSLHRYASDAAVITMVLHIGREFAKDRYRGPRWFSWFTGVPLLWIVFPLGITGYWLVWDQLAQYVAVTSSELMDWLPIFTNPMARNFLTPDSLSDRFFTLLTFMHLIGLPLFLVFGIWVHLLRVSRPRVNPPRVLVFGSLLALLVLSFIKPALSQGKADLAMVPADLQFDWFYLSAYPLLDYGSTALMWVVLLGSSTLLSVLPWLPPLHRPAAAVVDPDNCNGCGRCFADCPFGAVVMSPREDGSKYKELAVVSTELCTSCGICAGACPSSTPFRSTDTLVSGIDLPDFTVQQLREASGEAAATMTTPVKILMYGCQYAIDVQTLNVPGVAALSLPCSANLAPAFIDFALRREGVDGVLISGCRPGDCQFRFGTDWIEQRIAGAREPYLRTHVDRRHVRVFWAATPERAALLRELEVFRDVLRTLAAEPASGTPPDVKHRQPGIVRKTTDGGGA